MIATERELVDDFHRLWYDSAAQGNTWGGTTYFGHKVWKCPMDMWLYQELIWQIRPELIIETGTAFGGSALYFAHLFDQLGAGRVVTVDLEPVKREYPHHHRIVYIGGRSSVDPKTVAAVGGYARMATGPVMVILDSDHSEGHVLAELAAYAGHVTEASYLIVEDTNVNGHPVYPEHGPGPYEAVERWLPQHREFQIDERLPARMLFSMHTFLKKRRV